MSHVPAWPHVQGIPGGRMSGVVGVRVVDWARIMYGLCS
jgi:hypothetical protein